MPSTIRDLTELTVVAADDYVLISDTSDVTNRDKRISTTNLQLPLPKKTGTPVAGRLASWADANTLQDGSTVAAGTRLIASSASGLTLEDDGGNVGVAIADGGQTTIAASLVVAPVAGAVRANSMGILFEYSIVPGVTIGTTQTWTIDITFPQAGSNYSGIVDIFIASSSSANPQTAVRVMYRAAVSFYRTTQGATGVVNTTTAHISSNIGVTFTGPTAIADGIRFTIAPTAASMNRNACSLVICANSAPTVTSTVA